MAGSVVVFIDYQNMYRRARDAFYPTPGLPGHYGNFQPLALGRLLAAGEDRARKSVRVYTGVPAQERAAKDYEIMQRRTRAWENANPEIVSVHSRAMRYPPREGREKGVDVELAVDFVALAMDSEYDVGIVASADSDLIPAIELVARRFPDIVVETAAWDPVPEGEAPEPLDIPGGGVTRRLVGPVEFERLVDRTNYTLPPRGPAPGQSGRQLPARRRRRGYPGAPRIVCSDPGHGRPVPGDPSAPPSYNFKIFGLDGTFRGTSHLIRADLYQGQPCPQTGALYFFIPVIGYYRCEHF